MLAVIFQQGTSSDILGSVILLYINFYWKINVDKENKIMHKFTWESNTNK